MAMFAHKRAAFRSLRGIKIGAGNMADLNFQIASRLRRLTAELHTLERELKTEKMSDAAALHEFRHAIDEIRMTAWTVDELLNTQPERQATVASFLAAERIRRFAEMIREFSIDLEHQDLTWESGGVQPLFDSVTALHSQLEGLIRQHRAAFRNLKDEQG